MAYEEKQKAFKKAHNVIMEDRNKMTLSGVEDVSGFDESEIIMSTVCGSLILRGTGLKIEKLSLESGDVVIEGLITELSYQEVANSKSLWAKLFS